MRKRDGEDPFAGYSQSGNKAVDVPVIPPGSEFSTLVEWEFVWPQEIEEKNGGLSRPKVTADASLT
jgi:hypothetical protein